MQHKLQTIYYKLILPIIFRKVFKIITISNYTKSQVIKHFNINPSKIICIYNGFNHYYFQSSTKSYKSKKDFFFAPGINYPHKNGDVLILAFNKICRFLNEIQ